ncbi:MAG: cytochrome c peroxidase [Bacteroidota bacterium]
MLAILVLVACCRPDDATTILGNVPQKIENPTNADKIELGRRLFFDQQLSSDQSISCASCHIPELAFTDQKALSDGVKGRKSMRNAPSLLNVAYQKTLMFDGHITSLEEQAIVPIQDHFEMDMKMGEVVKRLRKNLYYQKAAQRIFKRDFDAFVLTRSLAVYERSLVSYDSDFDRYYYGKVDDAINASAKRGWKLFSEVLYCTKCHVPPHFTNFAVANNGYFTDGSADQGRFRIHLDSSDIGKFKVPSLRNVAITFPYMHDGKLKSFEEVLKNYESGGKGSRNQSALINKFTLTSKERNDLIAFLNTLTDSKFKEK